MLSMSFEYKNISVIKYDTIIDNKMSDEKEIIEKSKNDPQFFGLLFDKYHDRIFKYILHRTMNIELSRDLTSDTFYKALKNINAYKWKNIPLSSWLYRIASNEINGYFRKHGSFHKAISANIINIDDKLYPLIQEEIKDAHQKLEEKNNFTELHRSVEQLAINYQEVIVLRFFETKKIKEISEILNKSEGTIKSLIHRGLKQLKLKLNNSLFFREEEENVKK